MGQSNWLEYTATAAENGMTVEQILKEKMSVSGRMIQRLTRSKGIQLNRKPPYLSRRVKEGDRISVRIAEKPMSGANTAPPSALQEIPLDVLFEDQFFVIVNKPAGMMVHPVNNEQSGTLVHALTAYLLKTDQTGTVHAVHRLDKYTTGAVLMAKSSYAHQLADRVLREGAIDREYIAVLSGKLDQEEGTIDAPIGRYPGHATKRQVTKQGEPAVTNYQVIARSEAYTLVRVRLETGRTHQIRVHFQHIGHPLLGDTLYGGKRGWVRRQALHALKLSFPHPVTEKEISVNAPLPEDLAGGIKEEFGITL